MRPIPPFTDPFLFIMDEIKNTTEVEVNNVQPTEAEATVCNEAMPAEAKQNEKAEPTTKAEVIEALKDIVYNGGDWNVLRLNTSKCCTTAFTMPK